MNWRILKALTARGEVTRVQGNRDESTPPFRELEQIYFECNGLDNQLRKGPVKLSSLVALQCEHIGEEFVA